MLVFNDVPAQSRISELKKLIYERLMLTPNHALSCRRGGARCRMTGR